MKYIYYIIGILLLLTIGMAVQLSRLKIDISEPALVINDRIISRNELAELKEYGSYHSRGKGFLDAVITRELLIQEAVRQGINKEEAFRKSVENFYEQSLVKILIDRKYKALSPVITEAMIDKYKNFSHKVIQYTRIVYENEVAFQEGKFISSTEQNSTFENLSEDLKYSLLMLAPGETSHPALSDDGMIVVYRLDNSAASSERVASPDAREIKTVLTNEAKSALFDNWMNQLKNDADIQVLFNSNK